MKGQFIILSEILIFAFGIAIASFIIISFQNIQDSISKVTIKSQLSSIAKLISSAIIQGLNENSTIKLQIPEQVSGNIYLIAIIDSAGKKCDRGEHCLVNISTATISVAQELFNISQNYNIKGEVVSSAKYIEIVFDKTTTTITIRRV